MKERIRLVDDTEGRIGEVLVQYNPATHEVLEEMIDALPKATFYVAYGDTAEDLADHIDAFGQTCDTEKIQKLVEGVIKLPFGMVWTFTEPPSQARESISYLTSLAANPSAAHPGDHFGSRDDFIHNVRVLKTAYDLFEQDPEFAAFVDQLWRFKTINGIGYGSEDDIHNLQERAPDRVHLIPVDGSLSAFSRDRVLAGTDDQGEKVLVQGKMYETIQPPSMLYNERRGDLDLLHNPFWEERFRIIPNTEVDLLEYDGGDMRMAGNRAFIGPDTLYQNVRPEACVENFVDELVRLTGRDEEGIVCTGRTRQPANHLDMYVLPVNERTILVGETDSVVNVLRRQRKLTSHIQQSHKHKKPYLDNLAAHFDKYGFTVDRIPLYFVADSPVETATRMRSVANEIRDGNTVYTASFGIPQLDEMSRARLKEYGLDVHFFTSLGSIESMEARDPKTVIFGTGAVRCIANVLSKY